MNPPAKILVIDDELGIREGCKRALLPQGFIVDVAENGEEGLQKVRSDHYDLVLIDVMMPGVSGIDLLAPIHEVDPETVCIIITGYATVELAVRAIKQGAYDFITKPFTFDDLMLAVNQGLERRRLSLEAKRLQGVEAEARRLAEEKARLEEIDRAKRAYVRQVTHELRAPIAAIQSYLRLILEGYVPPERLHDIVQRAEFRAQEQLNLIADLLELSRIQEVQAREAPVLVQMEDLLRQVLEQVAAQAQEKKQQLQATIASDLPPVRAVPDQIKSVCTNLIGNAIKYTPEGGQIRVDCAPWQASGDEAQKTDLRPGARYLRLRVSDTGIGIPPQAQQRLFTEFFRAENAKRFTRQGTGLGLAIVKQIVEATGGRIWVESEVEKGSTFTVVLPAAEAS